MNPAEPKKRRSKSNQAIGESATLDPDVAGAVGAGGALDASTVACRALRASAPVDKIPATGAHVAGAWWQDSSPGSSEWMYPPSGFLNYLQSNKIPAFTQTHPFVNYHNATQLPENFHFVGAPMSYSTMSPTTPYSKMTPSPTGRCVTAQIGSQEKETIDIEDDDTTQPDRSDARSEKRLNWSNEEDIRLASAWLHNSIDPIDGNDKKSDQYWLDVTTTYNSTTKSNRMRNRNQLKQRWERIKKPVTEFNGCYARITKIHQSGMSEDQKMDQTFQLYASEHNDKPFTMVHVWRILQREKKWSTYLKKINKEKDRSVSPNLAHVVNVGYAPKQRPIGHKKAKDERNGKRMAPEAISVIDQKLDKFIEASGKAEKMGEVQQSLANKKLVVANLNHKAAQEQTKGKMIDLYKDLLLAPTSDLSEESLAERSKALECMRLALFAKDN